MRNDTLVNSTIGILESSHSERVAKYSCASYFFADFELENVNKETKRANRTQREHVSSAINDDHTPTSPGASYENSMRGTSCRLKTKEQQECKGRNVIVATPSSFV